jgi:raffinose/stachyose/melibiose transport system substrate-binding protein
METKKMNCVKCGSALQIPEDLEFINCSNCGSFLQVKRGEGYWALKLVGDTDQISDTSPVPVSTSNEARGDKPEASQIPPEDNRRQQLDQEISNLRQQIESVGAEIRMLTRERATASITSQMADLRWREFNLLEDWRVLLGKRYVLDTPDLTQNVPFIKEQISVLNLEIELIRNSFMQNSDMKKILNNLLEERTRWVEVLSTLNATSGSAADNAQNLSGEYSGLTHQEKSGNYSAKISKVTWILAGVCILAVITAGVFFSKSLNARNSAPSSETPAAGASAAVEDVEDTVQDSAPAQSETGTLKIYAYSYDENGEDVSQFIDEFLKTHPNITINWNSLASSSQEKLDAEHPYDGYDIVIRPILSSDDPLAEQFAPLGNAAELKEKYRFVLPDTNEGQAYGLGTCGYMSGFLYNTEVFKAAGITSLPRTPDEFLASLQRIKEKTDAVPLYVCNDYLLGTWDNFAISVSGDPEFWENTLAQNEAPFSAGEPLYELNKVLYDAVRSGYTNDASAEMDSFSAFEEGKVGVVGCDAGFSPSGFYNLLSADSAVSWKSIGLMPFPATVNGKQYVRQISFLYIGIRKDSPHQKVARDFVTAFLDYPDFAMHQDNLPGLIYSDIPSLFKNYKNPDMVFFRKYSSDIPMTEEYVPLINSELYMAGKLQKAVVDAARGTGGKTFDEVMDAANAKWAAVRKPQEEN